MTVYDPVHEMQEPAVRGGFSKHWKASMISLYQGANALRASAMILPLLLAFAGDANACAFSAVRAQIDLIIDKDAERAAKFRKEFSEGADSIAVLESLVTEEMRAQVDACRFDVAEYLTKRGFPPPH